MCCDLAAFRHPNPSIHPSTKEAPHVMLRGSSHQEELMLMPPTSSPIPHRDTPQYHSWTVKLLVAELERLKSFGTTRAAACPSIPRLVKLTIHVAGGRVSVEIVPSPNATVEICNSARTWTVKQLVSELERWRAAACGSSDQLVARGAASPSRLLATSGGDAGSTELVPASPEVQQVVQQLSAAAAVCQVDDDGLSDDLLAPASSLPPASATLMQKLTAAFSKLPPTASKPSACHYSESGDGDVRQRQDCWPAAGGGGGEEEDGWYGSGEQYGGGEGAPRAAGGQQGEEEDGGPGCRRRGGGGRWRGNGGGSWWWWRQQAAPQGAPAPLLAEADAAEWTAAGAVLLTCAAGGIGGDFLAGD
jgi:hypothetical protein